MGWKKRTNAVHAAGSKITMHGQGRRVGTLCVFSLLLLHLLICGPRQLHRRDLSPRRTQAPPHAHPLRDNARPLRIPCGAASTPSPPGSGPGRDSSTPPTRKRQALTGPPALHSRMNAHIGTLAGLPRAPVPRRHRMHEWGEPRAETLAAVGPRRRAYPQFNDIATRSGTGCARTHLDPEFGLHARGRSSPTPRSSPAVCFSG
ncbi:hypothetical protein B0H10DRAFT_2011858 [Mycena sp. CBHHK59/15]|nr:hypothetical protein B0H10DRAFT_2011858 [Mycena sp. CBHHK59/15]